jgi:hypothetical protein
MADDRTRASDQEREAVVAQLRAAAAEGRLDVDELDERTAAAYTARTRGALEALTEDLPYGRLPAKRAPGRKLPRVPGRLSFSARWRAPVGLEQAGQNLLEFVAPPMRAFGYELVERTPERLVFERESRPAWTIVAAVAVFPVGLLALLHTSRERVTIDLIARGEETAIVAQGSAPLSIRRALMELER